MPFVKKERKNKQIQYKKRQQIYMYAYKKKIENGILYSSRDLYCETIDICFRIVVRFFRQH